MLKLKHCAGGGKSRRLPLLTLWFAVLAMGSLWPINDGLAAQREGNRLVLLGTQGGPIPNPYRAQPATLLDVDGQLYLIDTGAGVSRQLTAAGYQPVQLQSIFLTHHHIDHTSGLASLMSFRWFSAGVGGQQTPPLRIFGPPGTRYFVDASLDYLSVSERIFNTIGKLPASRTMFEARDFQESEIGLEKIVYEDDTVKVSAVENSHYLSASTGPDGVRDMSLSYRFDWPGGSVVFSGDTGPSDALADLAKGADILVSEIDLFFAEPPLPDAVGLRIDPARKEEMRAHHTKGHLTPRALGELARQAGVKTIVLTHLVPGIQTETVGRYAERVAEYFHGEVVLGEDLMIVPLGQQ